MKVRFILLAAGNSRRFGSNKLLYSLDGKPMYSYGLDVMETLLEKHPECELCVVTRFQPIMEATELIAKKLSNTMKFSEENNSLVENHSLRDPLRDVQRVQVICSPESVNGISYSIKAGILAQMNEEVPDYYLFMVSDQPYVSVETIDRLIQETTSSNAIGGCVTWENTLGNPVIFAKELREDLLKLQGDKGGKSILKKYEEQICKVKAGSKRELEDKDVRDAILPTCVSME